MSCIKINPLRGMAIVTLTIAMPLFLFMSCMKKDTDMVEVVFDPQTTSTLKKTNIETLVSDSGITKCKVVTATWLMFGKASEPYWHFPDGIYLEKYDTIFNVEASVKADTAYHYERRKIWELYGNVDITTMDGVRIQAPKFFWDQNKGKFHSDEFISITNKDGTINTGVGFISNEDMTDRVLYNSTAEFLLDLNNGDTTKDSLPQNSADIDNPSPATPPVVSDSAISGNNIHSDTLEKK